MPLPELEPLTAAVAARVEDAPAAVAGPVGTARALVGAFAGTRVEAVPADVLVDACVEVAAELYYRRRIRHGIVTIGGDEGQPVRVAKDPMTPAYPLLRPWLGFGIGS